MKCFNFSHYGGYDQGLVKKNTTPLEMMKNHKYENLSTTLIRKIKRTYGRKFGAGESNFIIMGGGGRQRLKRASALVALHLAMPHCLDLAALVSSGPHDPGEDGRHGEARQDGAGPGAGRYLPHQVLHKVSNMQQGSIFLCRWRRHYLLEPEP